MLLGKKIKARRKELGYNADYLAKKTGLSRSTIFRYEKGDIEKIPTDILATLAIALKTSPTSLMGWEENELIQEITTISNQLSKDSQLSVLNFAKERLNQEQTVKFDSNVTSIQSSSNLYKVEGITEVAAGLGFGYDDSDTYTVYTDQEPPQYDVATLINGDSMEPEYHNGDMLYLQSWSSQHFSGQLLVIAIQDRSYFKRVYSDGDQLRLVSLNPDYDDFWVPIDEYTHIKTYRVVGSFTPIYD